MSEDRTASDRQEEPGGSPPPLSPADQRHLAAFEDKLQLVRDRTAAVVNGYSTGFFLHGAGGMSKSYTVLRTLKAMQADYKLFNSRMTGRGFYNALEKFPCSVHVMEDMEQIMRDRGAQGVLRSALWGQRRDGDKGPVERLVTWSTYKMEHSFIFTGGIIMISNRPLADLPELQAVKTRICCMHLTASDSEVRAKMREVSLKGYEHEGKVLDPAQCLEVCEYIIHQSLSLHRTLDMRLLTNSFHDYLQWQECDSACHWRDLVAARVKERPTHFVEEVAKRTRSARKQDEQQIAREIMEATADREERRRLWEQRTGKSEKALYRRMAEVKSRFSDSHFHRN
jgi:hypothetical protein